MRRTLQELRTLAGERQRDVATAVGITPQAYGQMETGARPRSEATNLGPGAVLVPGPWDGVGSDLENDEHPATR